MITALEDLVGTTWSSDLEPIIKSISNCEYIQVVRHNEITTADFRTDRVRVYLNSENAIHIIGIG